MPVSGNNTKNMESAADKIINSLLVNLNGLFVMVPPDIWPVNPASRRGLAIK